MLDFLYSVIQILITASVILFVCFVIAQLPEGLRERQHAWEQRKAERKQAKLDFEEAKMNAGIKRGEE
jgi:large-conductance mechanosensitive channel